MSGAEEFGGGSGRIGDWLRPRCLSPILPDPLSSTAGKPEEPNEFELNSIRNDPRKLEILRLRESNFLLSTPHAPPASASDYDLLSSNDSRKLDEGKLTIPSLVEKSTRQGGLLALLPLDRVLIRFPAGRPRKTCDSVPLGMLSIPPAPSSLALLTRPTRNDSSVPSIPYPRDTCDKSLRTEIAFLVALG